MKNRKELLLTTLLCLLPIPAGALLYDRLPERIATHFDMSGTPDGWSSRAFAVFGIPLMMAAMELALQLVLNADPKRQNMNGALRAVAVWTVPAVTILVSALILGAALGAPMHVETVVPLLVGLLFIVIGNYLPKTKQNYTVGIRLPWTLNSEENWNRTHRTAGFLWVVGGAVMVLLTLLHLWSVGALLALILALSLTPCVHSYLLYKKGI